MITREFAVFLLMAFVTLQAGQFVAARIAAKCSGKAILSMVLNWGFFAVLTLIFWWAWFQQLGVAR